MAHLARQLAFRMWSNAKLTRRTPHQLFAPADVIRTKPVLCVSSIRPLATHGNRPSLASRAAEFPEVIRQWHPHKNTVGPENVTVFSSKKFWFVCDEGHEWEAQLSARTGKGNACPTCNHKRATSTNSLLAKHPAVAAEWHPAKNGDLTPDDESHCSQTKVWWQCKEGHE
eukprot:Colp12_sorted_trinity150504_noHs@10740